jgi:hypothetical protein
MDKDEDDKLEARVKIKLGYSLKHAEKYVDDEDFVKYAIKINPKNFRYASERLRDDENITLLALKEEKNKKMEVELGVFFWATNRLKDNKDFMLKVVKISGANITFTSPSLREDMDILREAMKENPTVLKYVSKSLQNDIELLEILEEGSLNKNLEKRFLILEQENKKWLEERLQTLQIYKEEQKMKELMNVGIKGKKKKF